MGVALLSLRRQAYHVLDATAAAEHRVVACVTVALANDVCARESEFRGKGRGTGPLDILGAVGGALVLAPHHVDAVLGQPAEGPVPRDALQLRDWRGPPVFGSCAMAFERQGLDFGEENGVLRVCEGRDDVEKKKTEAKYEVHLLADGGTLLKAPEMKLYENNVVLG